MQQIYGIVNVDGKKLSGAGFTASRVSEGKYSISWDQHFADTPGVQVTTVRISDQWYPVDGINLSDVNSSGCMVYTMDSGKNMSNRDFSIIAIGD
ncbi:hypothetical protein ACFXPZ_03495 [Streptomyces sp. NPDC059101]|uniref:hypothetical protein n=1 Tax=unclassified Streptomyces TaxID=2593676 RepID=UPI0036749B1E